MKKIRKLITVLGLVVSTILVTSCSNNETVENTNPQITINDFEKVGKVYREGDPALKESQIGKTPEMAMTPIIFKKDGSMYHRNTPETLKMLEGDRSLIQSYYTDLQTFARVTNDPLAKVEYTECIGANSESNICIHDSYDPEPISNKEIEKKTSERNVSLWLGTSPFGKGDMIVGKWKDGNRYGHITIVYNESNKQNASLNNYIKSTRTFDAWSDKVPLEKQVGPRDMSEYWINSQVRERTLLRYHQYGPYQNNGLTKSQENKIMAYLKKQEGKPYDLASGIENEDSWYCSKLVYKAYRKAGIALIKRPWFYVKPSELRNSKLTKEIPF